MIANKTYNNTLNTLLRIAEHHKQISSTSVGDIWKVNIEKMQKFPLMHINPSDVQAGEGSLTYNFQIFIMDLVTERENWTENNAAANFPKLVKDLSNEQDVFNETLQISTDFISMLRHSEQQSLAGVNDINDALYFTEGDFSIQPFQERFDNLCCGWVFSIGVVVQNDFQACTIPVIAEGAGY
tara:strand:+ start:1082 stop:1630 length:549 start_codon:yes stop_codon:yes gene_type:complete